MRRLAALVPILCLGLASVALAYDGPDPKIYDATLEGIRVVMTTQGEVLAGGKSRIKMVAHVPIIGGSAGLPIDLEIREAGSDSDYTIATCSYTPEEWQVGQTVEIECEVFEPIPYSHTEGDSFEIYAYVLRRCYGYPGDVYHWGRPNPLIVPIRFTDDSFEDNDTFDSATNLGAAPLVTHTDLVSLDGDYFKVVAPPSATQASIRIDFWHAASDLDLYVYNSKRYLIPPPSATYDDGEALSIAVTPGSTYFIYVRNYSGNPAYYDFSVSFSPVDVVTITSGPSGTPNPVASASPVALGVVASDSLGHALTYAWQASCPSLASSGTFAPSASVQTPTWLAPANLTGVPHACTLTVTASDAQGVTATGSYVQTVASVPDTVTLIVPPTGSPNPVASGGSVLLAVTATDSLNHPLAYAWSATCPGLPSTGSFAPSATVQTPTWTAPANLTGSQKACTITATASDGLGHSIAGSHTQFVESVPDTITVVTPATGSPDPVVSEGTVVLGVAATDSLGHALTYAWQATCPGLTANGVFIPSSAAQNPTWTAPRNATGAQKTCSLQATITDGHGVTATSVHAQRVESVPDAVIITTAAGGSVNPVPSGGTVSLSVAAEDAIGHPLSYAWQAICPGLPATGTFAPSAAVQAPAWTAPRNLTGGIQTCTLQVTANDGLGHSATSSYAQHVELEPHTLTITSGPSGTPNPVASSGVVTVTVTAADSYSHTLSYAWSAACPTLAGHGSFSAPTSAMSAWTAPANLTGTSQRCTLTVSARDGQGNTATRSYEQTVSTAPNVVSITAGPLGLPNPVGSGGVVGLAVAANDLWGRPLTKSWNAQCPGLPSSGTFDDTGSATPLWTAPVNLSGSDQACTLTVVVNDGQGATQTATLLEVVRNALLCTYALETSFPSFPTDGGGGTLFVTAPDGCAWTVVSSAPWAVVTTAGSGTGTGTADFSVGPSTESGERSASFAVGDQVIRITQPGVGYRYYFAEGATINGFFETRIALLNPDPALAASVAVDFQLKDTATVLTHTLTIGAHQRVTLDVSTLKDVNPALAPLVSAEFSTVVRSDLPLVADRTMTWDQRGYGSHAETSITAPAATWYLAEGATIGDFELYYLIQNPNPVPVTFEVTYLLPPPAAPIVRSYEVGANTRTNIAVHAEPGLENAEVSAIIRAPEATPIIVERAMYLSTGGLFYGAAHESAGITAPATQWFFAEGATGAFFDLFILVANPNDVGTPVTATFLFEDGTSCSKPVGNAWDGDVLVVGPKSRYNIWVDTESIPGCPRSLADAAVSTTITSTLPVIAERTMWWPGPTAGSWAEAHNAPGATQTGTLWALADGEQGGPRSTETYLLVANTSSWWGNVRVTLYFEDGTMLEKNLTLGPNTRTNVPIGAPIDANGFGPDVANKRFGIVVESLPVEWQPGPAQIVVERAMYSNGPGAAFWAAGTDVLATRLR